MTGTAILAVTTLVSAALCAGLIVLLRPLLLRYALARPNARSSHRTPTPQGGGIAVIAATVLAAAVALAALPQFSAAAPEWPVVAACAVALAVIGAVDDIRPLEALPRLVLQMLIVAATVAALPSSLQIVSALPWWLERALMLLALVWLVNLTNFMDGIDWMTVAEIVPVTAALALLGLAGALPAGAMLIAAALCGAMAGFAPFNRPVARLFLGDVGSLPIGLLTGWLLIRLGEHHLAAALLLPLYYVADATVTLLRRWRAGRPLMTSHRDHFYQRALDGGMPLLRIVWRVALLNLALAALAFATLWVPAAGVPAVIAGALLVAWTLAGFERSARR